MILFISKILSLKLSPNRNLRIQCFLLFCLIPASQALAEVTAYEVSSRQPYANGESFGDVGAYEEISGRLYYEIDPAKAQNQIIVDLQLAPLNARGMVEMVGDFQIIAPLNPQRGNGIALVDIPNRGNRMSLRFNQGSTNQSAGDGYLMQEGYTLVWVGWEFDVSSGLGIDVPATTDAAAVPISGLGFAAARDIAAWIKYSPDALVSAEYLLSFGLSQSGRFLRSFLYLGFNTDESGRQVYDAMIPHIAGSSRIDLNRRAATPISQGQFDATAFPFADAAYTDPISGLREGLLENPRARLNQPRIFYTNSAVEYWGGGRVAALVHSSPDGSQDIELPANVRFYLMAGTQHSPTAFPPETDGNGQFPSNHLNYWWHMRALLSALSAWITEDIEPPASSHPSRADNTLVELDQLNFPGIPGVHSVTALGAGIRVANDLLEGQGAPGAQLPYLLPRVNEDGNEISGLLHPELQVPLATYTGWNFYQPALGDADSLVTNLGSYIPFSLDRTTRESVNDPRLSVAERYTDKQDFLDKIAAATQAGIDKRYILASDMDAIIDLASRHWDLLHSQPYWRTE
tara:strand:+ start:47599 stop:49320 length:1722 start_codon:yes stop_codon:yes gene_type:complete